MSEDLIIQQCAPTLAGIKTANLFSCAFVDRENLLEDIRNFNRKFVMRGMRMIPIRMEGKSALIYLYRPSKLKHDLHDDFARRLLENFGYATENIGRCVTKLIRRLRESQEFPHEIGLFLGYPPEDVHGFIQNKGQQSKCVGHWKVYGDEEAARKRFDHYKKCTRIYKEQYAKGRSIDRLAVATLLACDSVV